MVKSSKSKESKAEKGDQVNQEVQQGNVDKKDKLAESENSNEESLHEKPLDKEKQAIFQKLMGLTEDEDVKAITTIPEMVQFSFGQKNVVSMFIDKSKETAFLLRVNSNERKLLGIIKKGQQEVIKNNFLNSIKINKEYPKLEVIKFMFDIQYYINESVDDKEDDHTDQKGTS